MKDVTDHKRTDAAHFVHFIMLLKLLQSNPVMLKVAHQIKVPFADKYLTIPNHTSKPCGNIYNLIQCVEKNKFRTYFYTKNNLTCYYRKQHYENCYIIPDFLRDSYEIVSVKELDYRI